MTELTAEQVEILKGIKRALLTVATREEYATLGYVVIFGLLEVAGDMMKGAVEQHQTSLPGLLQQIDHLRAHIMPANAGGPISH